MAGDRSSSSRLFGDLGPVTRAGLGAIPVVLLLSSGQLLVWLVLWVGSDTGTFPPSHWMVLDGGDWTIRAFLLHPFFHRHPLHLAASVGALFFAGGVIERRWGSMRFGLFHVFVTYGSAAVACVVFWIAREISEAPARLVVFGGGAPALAALAAFSRIDPEEPRRFWMTRRHLIWAAILLGATGLLMLDDPRADPRAVLLPQTSSLLLALVFIWLLPVADRFLRARSERRRRAEAERVTRMRQRVDQLLAKISASGYDSLSPEERAFLRQASRHFRRDDGNL
jgi:membrane associated rhomboid family serine protease